MKMDHYGQAIPLIERAKNLIPNDTRCAPLETISLIFGWRFSGLDIAAQKRLCETLYNEGRTAEAVEILFSIIRTSGKEIHMSTDTAGWFADFTTSCATSLESDGDNAYGSGNHVDAVIRYSAALSLRSSTPASLLMKRSRALAAASLWEGALQDANEAVNADPSCLRPTRTSMWHFMESNGMTRRSLPSSLCCA